jgi:hypothetical protein
LDACANITAAGLVPFFSTCAVALRSLRMAHFVWPANAMTPLPFQVLAGMRIRSGVQKEAKNGFHV